MKPKLTPLFLVMALGFLVRVLWWAYAGSVPMTDFEQYRRLAEGLLEHGQLGIPKPSAYRLPGYPFFLAAAMSVSDSVSWLSFVNVILSTLLIYVVYRVSLDLTSKRSISTLAALICAFNPTFVFWSPVLASEHLYMILLLSTFLLLSGDPVERSRLRPGNLVLAGVLSGATVLTRGAGLFFVPVIVARILCVFRKETKRFLAVSVFLTALALTVAPWYIRNYYRVGAGAGLSTSGGVNFYFAHRENGYGQHSLKGTVLAGKDEVDSQKRAYELGFDYLQNASLSRIVEDIAIGTKELFLTSATYSVVWSTFESRADGGRPYPDRSKLWFSRFTYVYVILLLSTPFSLLFVRKYPAKLWIVLGGIVTMNWVCHACVFWGKARYRYESEVAFCILTAVVLIEIRRSVLRHKASAEVAKAPSSSRSSAPNLLSRQANLFRRGRGIVPAKPHRATGDLPRQTGGRVVVTSSLFTRNGGRGP